jgi:hypothetical protein
MRHLKILILHGAVTLLAAGCINSNTLIKVKADGSGTIEQTVLMNLAALKTMLGGLDPKAQQSSGGLLSESELKRAAERMGKGVRFVSSTPIKQEGFEGVKAIFAFDDVNGISIDQDPNVGASTAGQISAGSKRQSPVTFKHARQGADSVLTVTFDEKAVSPGKPDLKPTTPDNIDPAMIQMMKTMFQGFKVAIDLEVDGKIVKTNADYVNGSRITLMEIDMAGLLEDEAKLRALQSKIGPGASIADIKPLLKDVKGVKINHSTVTVEYR